MLDRNFILKNIKLIKENCKNRNLDIDIDRFEKLDKKRTDFITKIDELRSQRNENADKMKSVKDFDKNNLIKKGKEIKQKIEKLQTDLQKIEKEYYKIFEEIPNIVHDNVPLGKDEDSNKLIKQVGKIPKFDFKPKEHWEIGEALDLIDLKSASNVSGSRFAYLKGDLVLMEFALLQYVFSIVTDKEKLEEIINANGIDIEPTPFIPILPPVMMKPEVMQKMSRLEPKEERYHIQNDDLYLIGSAEHTMGAMHMGKTFSEDELPLRYIGFSTAFRREAGTYGKDMKGIIRVHHFDKAEFESFTLPEKSEEEQRLIISLQEYITESLGLPYQLVLKCTGDMGAPDFYEFDIETWLPGQDKYRETHTSDLMTDYQARRLNIKVKRKNKKTEFVHMNDATAFAGRTLIAILENYQNKDGSVTVPEVLQKYMNKKVIK